ncbi:beta-glucosidase [Alteromonas aestuariivivens]|uniref:Beta-glucosidase n=1 Tax=Alteromonas aestuariivivens TaxID=1938339 RepID=A0A3D8MAT6_9ALTE|nr:GH1 family beta-glucosidase [Alteromonas aestuariivivens]RDV26808.1 beta-glucosidase [Alteromonas aestuariivivens]
MKQIELGPESPLRKKRFLYGVATASFQIEGSADTRLPCIWDTFCRQPGNISDGSNGDIACDHVRLWQQDLTLLTTLRVDAYRFSVSWPRVMHQNGEINEQGMAFYVRLLNALNQLGIKPFVTLYHWDLPQHLEDAGGWLNRETAYQYQRYVEAVCLAFRGKVYSYATFNEPFCSAHLGYELGVHAPGKTGRRNGRQAAHHILLAHGLGMQTLQRLSPDTLNGIVLNFTPCYSATESQDDIEAAEKADQYINQWYLMPVMEGCYPEIYRQLPPSERPDVLAGDMDIICQPLDFLGINFYTRLTYSAPLSPGEFYTEHEHRFPQTDIGWEIYPEALTDLLLTLNLRYRLPPVYITENGAAVEECFEQGEIDDSQRTAYFEQHLLALEAAMAQGVDVQGYFAWSLLDNFEWAEGFSKRFGLVYVDYASQQRIIKHSGKAYQALLSSRV